MIGRARLGLVLVLATVLVLLARPAHAHKPSDAYLALEVSGAIIDVRLDLAVRDLDDRVTLDQDGDGVVRWDELRAAHPSIAALVRSGLRLASESGPCALEVLDQRVIDHSDGGYSVLRATARCAAPVRRIEVSYDLFFAEDPQHRCLVRLQSAAETHTSTLGAAARSASIELGHPGTLRSFVAMVKQGAAHIFAGIDHLLFVLALLLPAVLRREGNVDVPVERFRDAARGVLLVVTAFTLAHSITLAAGALGLVDPPSRVVESAIAASIVLAAANNVFGWIRGETWVAAFALGLLHGFGFASTLVDLGLPRRALVTALLGFNVGVELGQAACVLVFLPIAFLARRSPRYPRVVVVYGSLAIAAIALVWFVERAFAIDLVSRAFAR